ncbi:hypothetical protein O181_004798 [Austropuccinia psidii MF-1]|uniref:WHI2-like protein n=1 Tax=Austropuccinia psidii MF-1 TaxID=1389203 RepID=A0A9Q3GEX8_9BASI|nr:hypothetical protein [Austropuccinia psidii MF-1]
MTESILTSVPDPNLISSTLPPISSTSNLTSNQSSNVKLDLRNQLFDLDRDDLMELPESILLCLFPNGLVLSQKHQQQQQQHHQDNQLDDHSDQINESDHEIYYVDFDGSCLAYILKFFNDARLTYYGSLNRDLNHLHQPLNLPPNLQSPLFSHQAIIALREELEYFVIPPNLGSNSDSKLPHPQHHNLIQLKQTCGDSLLENKNIFTPFQKNINRENNLAEQHLIDMLCMSGFNRDDQWGYRSMEPKRCCITSLGLVLLKTGITYDHPDGIQITGPSNPSQLLNPQINSNQFATAQKLLLFWRKPARKCWWDTSELEVNLPNQPSYLVKLWVRRVWTLELSLI